jgi:hypothetical protein
MLWVTPVIGVSSCRLQRQIPGTTLFYHPGFLYLVVVGGAMDDEKPFEDDSIRALLM